MEAGHRIRIESPGGGGFGPPHERNPDRVAEDFRQGFVSLDSARARYGVQITSNGTVDVAATRVLRQQS